MTRSSGHAERATRYQALTLLGVALALRLGLAPITEGWDFHAYARTVWLVRHGHDVYAMPRAQLTLPWTYLPLCLNMFTALGWLAAHTGIPFRILGKLPTIAADLGIGWLLFRGLCRRGAGHRIALTGAALYLFNPLVLYDGAVVGRFDAIALFFLLLALESYRTRVFAPAFALAIAAKTFPLFVLPALALGRDRQSARRLIIALGLLLPLSLPYIVSNPHGLIARTLYDAGMASQGRLSWFTALNDVGWLAPDRLDALARVSMLLYPAALLALVELPLYANVAASLMLFVVMNHTVFEQYLLWPLPCLIVLALHERSRSALGAVLLWSLAGVLESEQSWSPYDRRLALRLLPTPFDPLNVAVALYALLFIAAQWRDTHRPAPD